MDLLLKIPSRGKVFCLLLLKHGICLLLFCSNKCIFRTKSVIELTAAFRQWPLFIVPVKWGGVYIHSNSNRFTTATSLQRQWTLKYVPITSPQRLTNGVYKILVLMVKDRETWSVPRVVELGTHYGTCRRDLSLRTLENWPICGTIGPCD